MQRISSLIVAVIVTLAGQAKPAAAQLDSGYGPFGGYGYGGGWGWGYGGAGSTVQGDIARGLGQFAVGAGVYNELTARAVAIDTDTRIRGNQYLYLSQLAANRRYSERYRSRRDQIVRAREKTYQRLRDNPTPRDIASGDALNVALDELNNPRISLRFLKTAKSPIGGSTVRDIPLQCPPAGITISVNSLLRDGPPPALEGTAFANDRQALEEFTGELRKEQGERRGLRPATIDKGLGLIRSTWAKVEAALPAGSAARRDAEAYLKGLSGLCRMLGTHAADVLLAGSDGRPETNLGELLNAMSLHDLRFGVAQTARQRAVYDEVYPLLVSLRGEARPPAARPVAAATPPAGGNRPPTAFVANVTPGRAKHRVVFNVREPRPE